MKLYINKRALLLAKVLRYGGMAATLLSGLIAYVIASLGGGSVTTLWLKLLALGAVAMLIGVIWHNDLYLCPRCGKPLLDRRRFPVKLLAYCGHCGLKVDIDME